MAAEQEKISVHSLAGTSIQQVFKDTSSFSDRAGALQTIPNLSYF